MPKMYQRTKNNPYLLPHDIYMAVIYIIRGYPRLKEEYDSRAEQTTPILTGMPKKKAIYKPTEEKALVLATQFAQLDAITVSLVKIPELFRDGIFRKIVFGEPWDLDSWHIKADWEEWEAQLVYDVAKCLHYV